MKFSFKFSNLLGTVYKKGNLVFTSDGNKLFSPVGNKITEYDLKNNKSSSLPVESRYNITTLAISPNGSLLIAVDEQGKCLLISLISRTVIHTWLFKNKIPAIKFSNDGRFFAVCKGHSAQIFRSPGQYLGEYNPFILEKVFHGSFDETTCLDWSSDSKLIAVGSKDTSVKIYSLKYMKNFRICSLGAHADAIIGVFFEENSLDVISISQNGRLCIWEASLDLSDLIESDFEPKKSKIDDDDDVDLSKGEERNVELHVEEEDIDEKLSYKMLAKHYLASGKVKLTTVDYHKKTKILVVGKDDGSFHLYELPDVNLIHSLTVTETSVSNLVFNSTGDWIAIGCSTLGQLVVWEWQSEAYILKQQGHSATMSALNYSSDGQFIVTGGEDGKVKLWNTQTGFCVVSFNEHSAAISAVRFANNKKFVISASLDGTVRAFDLARYRNFKTLTSTRPVQFASLAIDSSCEFVAAGGQDVFEIYLWSMKLGRLLEIISGHEGPVVSLDFNPSLTSTELVSVSWDKTLRIWNAIDSSSTFEAIKLGSDALAVTYKPDGKEVAVATLDGQISFFETLTGKQIGFIEGKNDLGSGQSDTDLITAKKSQEAKCFNCLCYSADGKYIIAAGQSKYVCIYSRDEEIIIKKYTVTENRSLDAVDDFINRRKMTEFGNINLIERREESREDMVRLPGAKKGDMASRTFKPEVRVYMLQFSPTNQSWAAVTTEGLLIYSLDAGQLFDPYQLEESITPIAIKKAKESKAYSSAIMMALRLNETQLIQEVVESVPPSNIEICIFNLPQVYIEKLLLFIANSFENSPHFEFYLIWLKILLTKTKHAPLSTVLLIQKNLTKKHSELGKICNFTKYTVEFILKHSKYRKNCNDNLKDEEMEIGM